MTPHALALDLHNNPTETAQLSLGISSADGVSPLATAAIASSSDSGVASVPAGPHTGEVTITAVGEGAATVTFIFDDPGATQIPVDVTVINPPSVSPSASPPTLNLDVKNNPAGTVTLSLGMSGDGVTPLATGATASSDDEDVATVAPGPFATEATVTATGAGTATVTFTFDDPDATTAAVAVTVTDGGNQGGGSTSGGSSTPDGPVAKTQLPATAFSWDGDRTLTIDYDSITPLGLLSVQWDDVALTRGTEYSVYSGSVIVRFSEGFIAAQPPGDHTIQVEFLNHTGETVIPLGIQGGSSGGSGGLVDDTDTHNPNTGGWPDGGMGAADNPNTGDGHGIWPALLLGSLGAAALALGHQKKEQTSGQ